MIGFKINPELVGILGENYSSIEKAFKELVDNAWDADAGNVWISIPDSFNNGPILIKDDGIGMTDEEVKNEYLFIANSRLSRKGKYTIEKGRLAKGRKGVGKFAGLMIAECMSLETRSKGRHTKIEFSKQELLKWNDDLEKINLQMETVECNKNEHYTQIKLYGYNSNYGLPNIEKLKELFILEYGREEDFRVYINGELLGIEHIQGENFVYEEDLKYAGKVKMQFTLSSSKKALRSSGIVIKISGKMVGKPIWFGLEDDDNVPRKLLKRVFGEINADKLANAVTIAWEAIIENSRGYEELYEWAREHLANALKSSYKKEFDLIKARHQKLINEGLSKLPEYRRKFAKNTLEKVLNKYYSDNGEKIPAIISVVLDAFEQDDYWTVVKNIDEAKEVDIQAFADALDDFGLVDIALMIRQAKYRLSVLDELDDLIRKEETLEGIIHKALENNLWIFGKEYYLISSNRSLKRVIEEYCSKKFSGSRAKKRPDLFLASTFSETKLLIEFKRPSHSLSRDDENQANKYRDDLITQFENIEVLVLGKDVNKGIVRGQKTPNIRMMSYKELIINARNQIEWLLRELND